MCGIGGFIYSEATEEQQKAWLAAMTESMRHRGPDGEGIWVEPPAALGHRRLSIIDLAGGSQPMMDVSDRAVVVFNGEIYNFREIREDLEAKGFRFKTRSDTEVLLNAYLDRGPGCLDSFEGMFAFAIWDRERQTLFAARDRMGKKPFYYTLQGGIFAFASELSAFSRLPFLKLEVDRRSVARFLACEYVPTPDSIYRGVFKLRPGHYLTLSNGEVKTNSYWRIPLPGGEPIMPEAECCERLRFLLGRAVKRRLVSDVPLGVFLSGGIDSSSIVAFMSEQVPAHDIKTFSIGFTEPSYDESQYARFVARLFGTDHHEEILSAVTAGDLLPTIVERQDEPMADPSVVPTFLLSQMTRKTVTVALGGDGGDELFAGYEYFAGMKWADIYRLIPRSARRDVAEPIVRSLPVSTAYVSPRHAATKFLAGAEAPPWLRTQIWLEACSQQLQQSLWVDPPECVEGPNGLYSETRSLYQSFPAHEPMNRVLYLFARQYLLDYILVKVDRCSMMHSLEVRAPYLDRDLLEFVFRLPARMKIRRMTRKHILKKAMKGRLPARIIRRKKRGFLIPTALWIKETLAPLTEELLGETHLKRQGLFRPEVVRRLLDEHNSGRADHRKELWTMLILQLWLHHNRSSIA